MILLPHFLRKKGVLSFKFMTFSIKDVWDITVKGMAAFITNFSIGLVTLFYNLSITHQGMGEATLSAYVIIGYLALIALTAFLGSSQGIQPAISFFAGSGDNDRIVSLTRSTLWFNLWFGFRLYGSYVGGRAYCYQSLYKRCTFNHQHKCNCQYLFLESCLCIC
ncbi:hypothetical protein MGH68_04610 [Erysipelothrix sp. D19-032]